MILFDTEPARYRHWRMEFDGPVARLILDVAEDGGFAPGYALKLNSYDLGVDIELNDALNRIRFEHPEVGAVVIASGKERVFSSGANIYMLGQSTHGAKVNFCKFTNETRNGMEDSSHDGSLKFVAAVNGACAGGGYELALACDEIVMVDDRSSTVSLPEVPLLGVLPGTGGLTRLIDKRKVRRDLADVFCTTSEGVRADRAKAWNLVDWVAPPARFAATVTERAAALAGASGRQQAGPGVALPPLERRIDDAGYHYRHVEVVFDREAGTATLTVTGPGGAPGSQGAILALGAAWWPLAMARELDDAILMLRANEPTLGTILMHTRGNPEAVLASDLAMLECRDNWFVRETVAFLRRTLARLDTSSRSLFAIADRGSCFAGTLAELLLAADRAYMLAAEAGGGNEAPPRILLSTVNFGIFPMPGGISRLKARFCGEEAALNAVRAKAGHALDASEALELGLVTFAPDELDWDEELRLAVEERASLSPDALSGLEANLRFTGPENLATRVFGRLSAWQNWIFNRPNAVGPNGALKLFGTGTRPRFDRERI
ncbi:MAG TPA: 2,3-epoxybenzoyl-CoA dihydrolase [Stellaceae bacterium]|nr:2,3-epoxybenzoyl-CoA dihydrolase [Stellaceae bacterium]